MRRKWTLVLVYWNRCSQSDFLFQLLRLVRIKWLLVSIETGAHKVTSCFNWNWGAQWLLVSVETGAHKVTSCFSWDWSAQSVLMFQFKLVRTKWNFVSVYWNRCAQSNFLFQLRLVRTNWLLVSVETDVHKMTSCFSWNCMVLTKSLPCFSWDCCAQSDFLFQLRLVSRKWLLVSVETGTKWFIVVSLHDYASSCKIWGNENFTVIYLYIQVNRLKYTLVVK